MVCTDVDDQQLSVIEETVEEVNKLVRVIEDRQFITLLCLLASLLVVYIRS